MKTNRITGTLHADRYTVLYHLAHFLLELEMFQTKVVEKIKHTFCIRELIFENRAIYEIMWENTIGESRLIWGGALFHTRWC